MDTFHRRLITCSTNGKSQFQEMFENTKGVTRSRKLKKNKQHNIQRKKDKMTINDLLNTTQKMKYRETRISFKTERGLRCFTCDTRHVAVKRREHHLYQ